VSACGLALTCTVGGKSQDFVLDLKIIGHAQG
jgi:hypothetical protein